MAGKLIVISAPSGTGKTTLVRALLEGFRDTDRLKLVITYTTRSPRSHEIDGRDYHFIEQADFERKRETGFFLEWVEFCGHFYGSPAFVLDPAFRQEISYLLIIDHTGGSALKDISGVVLIWITPPSLEELRARLEKREKDSGEIIEQRLQKAQEELARETAQKVYTHHLVNDEFEQATKELKSLVEAAIGGLRNDRK